jgi:hypothetical protein
VVLETSYADNVAEHSGRSTVSAPRGAADSRTTSILATFLADRPSGLSALTA